MKNFINENKLWVKITALSLIAIIVTILIMNTFQLKVSIGYTEYPLKNLIANIVYSGLGLSIITFLVSAAVLVIKLLIKLIKW